MSEEHLSLEDLLGLFLFALCRFEEQQGETRKILFL